MKTAVIDYGHIPRAKKNADGTISFYGRVASANRPYRYINPDGSTRIEVIKPVDLFNRDSLESIKLQVVTNGHTYEKVTPENYRDVASGTTGNLVINGADGDFLGIVGKLQSKDAIQAYESGIRELSPAYTRNLVTSTLNDGWYYQKDRDYYEVALVDKARGGSDVRIKDSDDLRVMFDLKQLDESIVNYWSNIDSIDNNPIDRLLQYGTLNPKPIDMDLIKFRLFDADINIDRADVQAASKAVAETAAKLDKIIADNAAIAADNAVLKASLAKANESLGNKDTIVEQAVKDAIAEHAQLLADSAMFESAGIKIDPKYLSQNDNHGFKSAVIQSVYGSEYNNDGLNDQKVTYLATVNAYKKMGAANENNDGMMMSSSVKSQMTTLVSGGEQSMLAGNSGYSSSLPPDDMNHGWY